MDALLIILPLTRIPELAPIMLFPIDMALLPIDETLPDTYIALESADVDVYLAFPVMEIAP